MRVTLQNVAKRYQRDWIFKNVNLQLTGGTKYAVTGSNGSGKSTFIQLIAANLLPTLGSITYRDDQKDIEPENVYSLISFAAPYIELPDEFSMNEFLKFHFRFKSLLPGFRLEDLSEFLQLEGAGDKYIRNFSTGMKQRLKLGTAVLSDVPILLLDEPATNLDQRGLNWYRAIVQKYSNDRLLIVCSNRNEEYDFCEQKIDIEQLKS